MWWNKGFDPLPSEESSSNSSLTNIELLDINVPEKYRLFHDDEEEIEQGYWQKCKLNVILSVVLFILLSLIFLELRFMLGKHELREPIFNKFDFNSYPGKEDWRLKTDEAYKLDKNFVKNNVAGQVREFDFEISSIEALPDGVWKNLTVINGAFPGPLIECQSGDTIVINLKNNGIEPTTLHFHGLYQNGTNYYDGSSRINQCDIPVGGEFKYNFTILEEQWGTYWYHSHYKSQYADGLFGPFIIHSKQEDKLMSKLGQHYDEEKVVIFNDWYHEKLESYIPQYLSSGNENTEPTPDNGLIQGTGVFDCSKTDKKCDDRFLGRHVFQFDSDTKYRLRLINAGFFLEIDFSVDQHEIEVIEADGTNVDNLELDVLRIAVAQRYSVILHTDQKSDSNLFYMRARLNSFCFAYDNPNLDLDLKLIISVNPKFPVEYPISNSISANSTSYGHPNVRCRELNETLLVPLLNDVPEVEGYYLVDSSFQIKAQLISLGYMNDVTYKPVEKSLLHDLASSDMRENGLSSDNGCLMLTMNEPRTVDILINNFDDGSHPFHLHGYKFWVMKFGQGYFKPHRDYDSVSRNPMKRDTVNISGYGYVLIRVVLDNPGIWPLHCHIGWHMEAGLLMVVNVMPQNYRDWEFPADWSSHCQLNLGG